MTSLEGGEVVCYSAREDLRDAPYAHHFLRAGLAETRETPEMP